MSKGNNVAPQQATLPCGAFRPGATASSLSAESGRHFASETSWFAKGREHEAEQSRRLPHGRTAENLITDAKVDIAVACLCTRPMDAQAGKSDRTRSLAECCPHSPRTGINGETNSGSVEGLLDTTTQSDVLQKPREEIPPAGWLVSDSSRPVKATKGAEAEEEVASLTSTASGVGIDASLSTTKRGAASQICLPTVLSEWNSSDRGTMSPISGGTTSPSTATVSAVDHMRQAKLSSTTEAILVPGGDVPSPSLALTDKIVKPQQLHDGLSPSRPTPAFSPFEILWDGKRVDVRDLHDSTWSASSSLSTSPSGTPSSCRSRALNSLGRLGLVSESLSNSNVQPTFSSGSHASSLSLPSVSEGPSYPAILTKLSKDGLSPSSNEEGCTDLAVPQTKKSGSMGAPHFPTADQQSASSPAPCAGAADCSQNLRADQLCRFPTEDRALCGAAGVSSLPCSVWSTTTENSQRPNTVDPFAGGVPTARCGCAPPPQPPPGLPHKPAASSFTRYCGLALQNCELNATAVEYGSPLHRLPPVQRPEGPLENAATHSCCVATTWSPKDPEGQCSPMSSKSVYVSHDSTVENACYTRLFERVCRQHAEEATASVPEVFRRVGEAACARADHSGASPACSRPWCGSKPSEHETCDLKASGECAWRDVVPTGDLTPSTLGSSLHAARGRMTPCSCDSASAGCVSTVPRCPSSLSRPCSHGQQESVIPVPPPSERLSCGKSATLLVPNASGDTATVHLHQKRIGEPPTASERTFAFQSLPIESFCKAQALVDSGTDRNATSPTQVLTRPVLPSSPSHGNGCAQGQLNDVYTYERQKVVPEREPGNPDLGNRFATSCNGYAQSYPASCPERFVPAPPKSCAARHVPLAVPMPTLTPVPVSFPPTVSSTPVSLLLTLPLNLPFGRIIKFGVPSALAHLNDSGSSQPALSRGALSLRRQRVGGGRGDGNNIPSAPTLPPRLGSTCDPQGGSPTSSVRSLGAKKSYFCFSPLLHEAAYTLLSHAGGICDTFAASLHLELAILYLPPAILPWVGAAFNHLTATFLPRFDEPLKLECGGLQERNAPGRLGGKVLTVGCAIRQAGERQKFQRMQEFLSQFEREVENLLRAYALQHPTTRTRGSQQVSGAYGRCTGRGQEGMRQAGMSSPNTHCTTSSSPGEVTAAAGPFELCDRSPKGSPGPQPGDVGDGVTGSTVSGLPPGFGGAAAFGRKHNVWRYSMGCVPSSVLPGPSSPVPPPELSSSASQIGSFHQPGWHAPSTPASGSNGFVSGYLGAQHLDGNAYASRGMHAENPASPSHRQRECGSTKPLALSCEGGNSGGSAAGRGLWGCLGLPGGCLDLTVRAFETRALEKHPREYARLVVRDICVSEVRLVTTRGIPGMTCEIDPRFEQYCIGTRPILTTPDGQLCRHSIAPHWLSDIWEVRLKTQSQITREQQKRLVEQYVVGEIECRPQAEQRRLLDIITRLGATVWVNGRPAAAEALTPPPPLPVKVPDPPRSTQDFQNADTPSTGGKLSATVNDRSNDAGLRLVTNYDSSPFSDKTNKEGRACLKSVEGERCANRDTPYPPGLTLGDLTGPRDEESPRLSSSYTTPPRFPSDSVPRPGGATDEGRWLREGEQWLASSYSSRQSHLANTVAGASTQDQDILHAESPSSRNDDAMERGNGSVSCSTNCGDIADREAVEERLFQLSLCASQRSELSTRHSQGRPPKPYRCKEDGMPFTIAMKIPASHDDPPPLVGVEAASGPSHKFQASNHGAGFSTPPASEKVPEYGSRGVEQRSKEDTPSCLPLQKQLSCSRQSPSGRTVSSFSSSHEELASSGSSNASWGSIFSDSSTTTCGSCPKCENVCVGTAASVRTTKKSSRKASESLHPAPPSFRILKEQEPGASAPESWSQRRPPEQTVGGCRLLDHDEQRWNCPAPSQNCDKFSGQSNATAASLWKQLLVASTHKKAFQPYEYHHVTVSSTDGGDRQAPMEEEATVTRDENRGMQVASGSATEHGDDDLQQLLLCAWLKEANPLLHVTGKDSL
ncbi:hypothetical protein TGVAND_311380 [Toxoplasma gondii VAND]|uniref:Uncharacterized protein n=1 Tax=Toxoplasma gondii VAND TaxID=933077 RepID=A0A086QA81_TOXGO|nr:hypothetical protein TGVAND_311380 [Toxoplasma gondii VAND]